VDIGGKAQTFTTAGGHPLSYFEMPFDGRTGPVTIKLDGKAKTGPAISNNCPPCGHVSRRSCIICWLDLGGNLLIVTQVVFNSVVIDI
jgi:glucan endo-1,3-alpha-glucosidase